MHHPYTTKRGYVMEYHPEHPRSDARGYVFAHIVAYEKYHKTSVPEGFVVHHINEIKTDNSPQNLALVSRKDHTVMHHLGKKRSAETKAKISTWAKTRLSDPTKHPMFKPLDEAAVKKERMAGVSVKEICHKYGISKYTYYTRITGYRREK